MKLLVDYDPYIRKEAQVVADIIKKIFGYKVSLRKKEHQDFLEFEEEFGIYRVNFPKDVAKTVYVTGNQLLSAYPKSVEDFCYGVSSPKTKSVIISLARLRGLKGEDSSILRVSRKEYERRIKHLTAHEVGHWAVENQYHFDDYAHSIFDQGPHCKDPRCVMYPGATMAKSSIYRKFFCPLCIKNLIK